MGEKRQEHRDLFGNANLALPASVASQSRIRRAKQHLRELPKMPPHGSTLCLDPKRRTSKRYFCSVLWGARTA